MRTSPTIIKTDYVKCVGKTCSAVDFLPFYGVRISNSWFNEKIFN